MCKARLFSYFFLLGPGLQGAQKTLPAGSAVTQRDAVSFPHWRSLEEGGTD